LEIRIVLIARRRRHGRRARDCDCRYGCECGGEEEKEREGEIHFGGLVAGGYVKLVLLIARKIFFIDMWK
jgi:hypothetical protein